MLKSQPQKRRPPEAAPPQAQQQSFFSKLTWVHYAGAGVAALLVVGVVVGLAVFALTRGNKVEPVKPKALTEDSKPAPQPTAAEQPAAPTQTQGGTAQGSTGTPSAGDNGGTNVPPPSKTEVVPVTPVETSSTGDAGRQSAGRNAAQPKPSAPAQRPRNDAPADAAKRRKAALNALDQ